MTIEVELALVPFQEATAVTKVEESSSVISIICSTEVSLLALGVEDTPYLPVLSVISISPILQPSSGKPPLPSAIARNTVATPLDTLRDGRGCLNLTAKTSMNRISMAH